VNHNFSINLEGGSVSFQLPIDAAKQLKAELAALARQLSERMAAGSTPTSPQPPLEYRHAGDVFFEVFCNPNIWPSAFAAKLLITVRDDRIRLVTEAELTQTMESLSLYLEQLGVD
jgi:hypothetical protein